MYVCNDEDVNIISNLQSGWSYRKMLTWYNGYLGLLGDVTSSDAAGIYWHTRPSSAGTNASYGIYKTAGSWTSNNYQQLKLDWSTGIILDGGSQYGKSGVEVINKPLRITASGNTVSIGSANNTWCHIYNSAAIDFIFNRSICVSPLNGSFNDTEASLGNYNYPWHRLVLGGVTNATMTTATTNPRIIFQEGVNPGTQKVAITYTDYDAYGHGNKGLKVHDVDGNDGPAWFEVEGTCYVGNLSSSGYVTALVSNSSDKRLKKEIKPFNAKQIIDKLKPVEFEWNKKANKYNNNLELNKKNYGLIAQDSDGIIDNLVFDLPDGKGYKGVRYEKLIPILLQAVKEQQKEIDELKQIIKKLKI